MNPMTLGEWFWLQPPGGRETAFQRIDAPPLEGVPGGMLLVLAYAVTWVLVALFVLLQWRRQKRLGAQIAEMERRLGTPPRREGKG